MRFIINNNIAEQNRCLLKQLRTSVKDGILNQGYGDAEASLSTEVSGEPNTPQGIEEPESPQHKKRKGLHLDEYREFSNSEKLSKLTEY